jgi:phosphatidylglycerol:prolipoprotein diacylglycerol transferase
MCPDLFSIGPLTLHTYGLFVAIGFVAALSVTLKLSKSHGLEAQQVMDMSFAIIIWGIIGSRLLFVLMNFSHYKAHPVDIFKVWEGGLVFSGGIIAAAFAAVWYARKHHLSFWDMGDLCTPGLAIGQGIGRIGCFMAGCCYGKPTDKIWGIVFTHPNSLAPLDIVLHPTQLYSLLSGLVIFLVLLLLHAKRKYEGQVLLWFLILHSTGRLLIERFRGDDRGLIPGTEMSVTQLVAILILTASVVALFALKSRKHGEQRP